MKTYGDFFTGFGGMTIGAKAAGLDVLFGVEWEEALANVYRQNLGNHIIVADVTKLDMSTLPYVDIFHASPPCTNASVANANGGESPFDMAMARAVCRYIKHHKPQIFTMENVYQYRNFESWHKIARTLLDNGYEYRYWHVLMANYGVPQTRKRMIVVARRDGISPSLPEHTHAENPVPGLFGIKARWVSWYEAIEDLIPALEVKKIRPKFMIDYDIEKLDNILLDHTQTSLRRTGERLLIYRHKKEPSITIMSNMSLIIILNKTSYGVPAIANARFQSFPDWYELPDKASLAVKGIGNAVPPLFAEKLYKHIRNIT